MPSATTQSAPPSWLEALIERFDADAFDAPTGVARIRLTVTALGEWDVLVEGDYARLEPPGGEAAAVLAADEATWRGISRDVRGGMEAYSRGRLQVRHNLHLGVGLLAATSGGAVPGRLRFDSVETGVGRMSFVEAGVGEPVVALHGLGGTKASFLPTIAALAESYRVVAIDLPGFGESAKPIGAPYDAPWFARSVLGVLDELDIDTAHLVGNSMGGRVALEAGLLAPERVGGLVLLCPALAWLRDRRWAGVVRILRPELGLLQVAPRPVVEGVVRRLVPGATEGWTAAGLDEFLRAYLTARGRAAFYAAARNIYLDEPQGEEGFWTRLGGLEPDSLFIWGRQDRLVPVGFRRHVEHALGRASHLVLDCGHVPQVEAPGATHRAIRAFLSERPLG